MVPAAIPKRHMDRKYQLASTGVHSPCARH
jgi:hypothetical protein